MTSFEARPHVAINMALTLDGKTAPVVRAPGGPLVLSRHAEDPRRMRALRGAVDAVVIGAENLRHDHPDLALAADEHARRRAGALPEPLRVVVTTRGDGITPEGELFDPVLGGPTIVAHAESMPASTRAALSPRATLVALGDTRVDIVALLAWLRRERGCARVLSEGGAALNAQLFAARAVDSVYLTLVPRVLGGARAPGVVGGEGFALDALPDATLGAVERVGDELFLRYDFRW